MISSLVLAAAFQFANVCSDDMVLQRDVDVPVWGFGEKGKTVEVALNGKKVGKAVVGEDERWMVKIPAQKANRKPSKIAAKCGSEKREITGVLFGDVWFGSGQSNMAFSFDSFGWKALGAKEFVAKGGNPLIRTLHMNEEQNRNAIKPRENAVGVKWQKPSAETLAKFSAALYWMGDRLQKELDVPIGLVDASWGATSIQTWLDGRYAAKHGKWHPQQMAFRALGQEKVENTKLNMNSPCSMFNGLVYPLFPMGLKGVVWYQGCSNLGFDTQWTHCLETIVGSWREKFTYKDRLPVIITEIAPHAIGNTDKRIAAGENKRPDWSVTADMRRANIEAALAIPDCSFVSLLDLGEKDIHPVRKQEVGERWALTALQNFYGKNILGTSPSVEKAEYLGNRIVLHFRDAKGLKTRDGLAPKGFEISGAPVKSVDSKGKEAETLPTYFADAKIVGDTIVLTHPKVTDAFSYRYAWFDLPQGWNVVNGADLPLGTCRGYKDGKWRQSVAAE